MLLLSFCYDFLEKHPTHPGYPNQSEFQLFCLPSRHSCAQLSVLRAVGAVAPRRAAPPLSPSLAQDRKRARGAPAGENVSTNPTAASTSSAGAGADTESKPAEVDDALLDEATAYSTEESSVVPRLKEPGTPTMTLVEPRSRVLLRRRSQSAWSSVHAHLARHYKRLCRECAAQFDVRSVAIVARR